MKKNLMSFVLFAIFVFVFSIKSGHNYLSSLETDLNSISNMAMASNELPEVSYAIGESTWCVKNCELGWDGRCINFDISFGTKVDCSPGGSNPCQPSTCI